MKHYEHYKGEIPLPRLVRSPVETECTYLITDIDKLGNIRSNITNYAKRVGGKVTIRTITTYPRSKPPTYTVDSNKGKVHVVVKVVATAPVRQSKKG